ncbi:hypothetical protein BHE74_00020387 [Ensete ventricosum]|uniref:Uncharacterized protein n=1 Tax=Ensete ventricosum TaxID=4639 RepID=A0A444EKY6_ENSVE|nr:hypothetical protein B296_00026453 [Ensete ventricosum]RWW11050.1 hypothetical protein GW17_00025367 [Ensete ventricosum]RWW71841.1 hypothetical protein BHE74_00020387 [Ensete ventricosum]RZR85238.1 hypothetical protein BHM03_00012192 [Ensete ventricosum]
MLVLCAGILLLAKVIVEGYVKGVAGLWSLNMRERVVREKLGSGLVVVSMLLQLKASRASEEAKKGRGEEAARSAESGEPLPLLLLHHSSRICFDFSYLQSKSMHA